MCEPLGSYYYPLYLYKETINLTILSLDKLY